MEEIIVTLEPESEFIIELTTAETVATGDRMLANLPNLLTVYTQAQELTND